MENQVAHPEHHRRRVRVPRKRTLAKRIKKLLEMPHLKRRERNQRIAIGAVILMLGLYVAIVRPIIDYFFPYTVVKKTTAVPVNPKITGATPKGR